MLLAETSFLQAKAEIHSYFPPPLYELSISVTELERGEATGYLGFTVFRGVRLEFFNPPTFQLAQCHNFFLLNQTLYEHHRYKEERSG